MIPLSVYRHICCIFVHVVVYVCAFMGGGGWGNDTSGREAQEVNSEWQLVNASQHHCNPSVLNIFLFETRTNIKINTSNTSYLLLLVE